MSSLLVIMAMVFGGATAAFVPRVAYRLAVAFGEPPHASCDACGRRFPAGLRGWVRAGAACEHGGRFIRTVLASTAASGFLAVSSASASRLPLLLVAVVLGVLLATVDLRCLRLPDPLVALLAVVAGLALLNPSRLPTAVAAGVLIGAGYLALALLPGRGLGLGDVKLGAVLAFALGFGGWPVVIAGFVTAHLLNGVVAVWLLITRRAAGRHELPFGPALLAGALLALTTA